MNTLRVRTQKKTTQYKLYANGNFAKCLISMACRAVKSAVNFISILIAALKHFNSTNCFKKLKRRSL